LWHACQLGRGAAYGFSTDVFDALIFAQPYFDPKGMILALDEDFPIGFVHVGFPPNAELNNLNPQVGIICALMVLPEYRRQHIGTQLLEQAYAYMKEKGSQEVQAGCLHGSDPFYLGLYGGTRPSGFLLSDELAAPFFTKQGYKPIQEYSVFQRDLQKRDPVSFRLVNLRRRMELVIRDTPYKRDWWWYTRFGRLDTVRFLLKKRGDNPSVAGISILGLDQYVTKWNERCIGFIDLFVEEKERRSGYAQLLILEVMRRMREEMVTLSEVHLPSQQQSAIQLAKSCGFEQVDQGVVYQKTLD
jgi:GNAT superfamily N-acetyltransferase